LPNSIKTNMQLEDKVNLITFPQVRLRFVSQITVLCTTFFAQSTLDFTTVKSRNVMKGFPHYKQQKKKEN
jgi:hypothetical protein